MNEAQTRLNLIDLAIRAAGARNLNSEEDPSAHGSDIPAHGTRALRRIGFLVVFFLGSGMVAVAAWTKETKKTEYTFDGLREDYVITESSDYGIVTNSISRHDFLGRKIFEWTPRGTTTNVYDGATPRVLTSTFTSGGVSQTTTYLYNLLAQPVGTVINGITNRTDVTYEEISNQVWHVTTTSVIGPHTNSVSFFKKQLTGLVNGLRGRTVRMGADGVTTTSERTFNDETNIETEKENRSTGEWSITHRMYGLVLDVQTAEGTTFNAYDAFGRVAGVYFARPNGPTNPVSRTTYTPAGDVASVEQFTNGVLAARETYEYNALGQRTSVTNALGHSTHTSYDPFGNVLSEDGATYPTRYSYDTSGRRTAMWTTRDGSSWDETRWTYDPRTGFCTSKVYADGSVVRYDHASDGLLTRTTYPSGRWKENVYGQNRELCGVRYSMASMDYDLFLDSFGMATNVANAAGDTWSYFYGINSTLTNESWQVDGCLGILSHETDRYMRPIGCSLRVNGQDKAHVGFQYDANNRVDRLVVTNDMGRSLNVTYSNNMGYVCGYVIALPGGNMLRRIVVRDQQRPQLINAIDTVFNGQPVDSRTYSYDALGQPIARDSDRFSYNSRGELTNAVIGVNAMRHAYDQAGNHVEHAMNAATNHYTHNALNQMFSVTGNETTNLSYSADGELAFDGLWNHAYDVESRLVSSSPMMLTNGAVRVLNNYDYRHRRIGKVIEKYMGGEWLAEERHAFVYDGWNLVHETVTIINGPSTNVSEVQYFWGLDLSASLDGAGGVGGLLAVSLGGAYYFPVMDNIGNIVKYVDESGQIVAECEYDDFGRMLSRSGNLAGEFNFWASTRYLDRETGLYCYPYRFYSPVLRCWLTRDPLGEEVGCNLYLFVKNNFIAYFDGLGLKICVIKHLPGSAPTAGWGGRGRNNAETHYKVPTVSYQKMTYTNGKVRYRVVITPSISFVDVYFRNLQAYTFLWSDEQEHVALIRHCDAAIESFKTKAESIYDCVKPAEKKLSEYLNDLDRAIEEYEQKTLELDKPGGKHGH